MDTEDPNHIPTRGASVTILSAVLSAVIITVVICRLYARKQILERLDLGDGFIVCSLLTTLAFNAILMVGMIKLGWNHHVWDIPLNYISVSSILTIVLKIVFVTSLTFTRLSLIHLYYSVIQDAEHRLYRVFLASTTVFVFALWITSIFVAIFMCDPVRAYWTYPRIASRCLSESSTGIALGAFNSVADFAVTFLPIPLVKSINMPLKLRLAVLSILCIGFLASAAGVVRVVYVWIVSNRSADQTWEFYPLWIVTAVEVNVALLCACAPAIRLFIFRIIVPRFFMSISEIEPSEEAGNGDSEIGSWTLADSNHSTRKKSSVQEAEMDFWEVLQAENNRRRQNYRDSNTSETK